MKPIILIITTSLISIILSCSGMKSLSFQEITTEKTCIEKGGTWYNGKCWKDFEDDGISKMDIDATVQEQMLKIKAANIKVNEQTYPLLFFFPEMDKKKILLITLYQTENDYFTIVQEVVEKELDKKEVDALAALFKGNLIEENAKTPQQIATGNLHIVVNNLDELDLSISGVLKNTEDNKTYNISYRSHETITGAGMSTIEVKGTEAHINGELGTKTYQQLKNMIDQHPEVKTLVLGQINGSVNDAVNMHTGRILREAGLNTKVLSNSSIASGGVDLFCAGQERIVEKGAKIGIHSWCCLDDLTAVEIPKDHPAHKYQIEYFTMCLGEQLGPDFYFHTLTAASFDGIHWMSEADMVKWKVATKTIGF